MNQTTTYIPQGSFLNSLDHAAYTSNDDGKVYVTDAQHTGEVNLTYVSKATGQAAGTFHFTAVNPADRSQTITITDGRFDRQQ
ncbi:DUF6252 family protein [Hymenobacter sediminicola]|uniref:Uncharacterized protein n=1 Tax=Hymenobacter sediminicola TaxID=2761579 RepID=A0A7G7W5F3_9BACT|nr:DUF6252 family protein [Hymenobacter sediminicola]QNH61596.1 hypothetical protein H4317_15745 [Hymenobacter sediminicola]